MSNIVEAHQLTKLYGNFTAINNVSFSIEEGKIYGLLGRNGAGKTTTMRMILDIIRPDRGQITWNGESVRKLARRNWGYLPEERGLYPKMVVEEQLLFLARLNGSEKRTAQKTMDEWFERFQMQITRKKKVEELSKGNQQKVQFLATILHDPAILIMDEPFSGLDPVNANVLKEAFLELHQRGKTIIFSTHQLEQVEEMCEDVMIINKGECVVQGSVREVKRQHGKNLVRLKLDNDPQAAWLDEMADIQVLRRRQDYIELQFQANFSPNRIVEEALRRGGLISRFEITDPSLTDIFIEKVGPAGQTNVPTTVHA